MLEALKTLATVSGYTMQQLEHVAEELGDDHKVYKLSIPVATLIRAKREYESLRDPEHTFRTFAEIAALAEAHIDKNTPATFLALKRGVDNLRKVTS